MKDNRNKIVLVAMCLNLRWELSSSIENFAQHTWPSLPSRPLYATASTQIKIHLQNFHVISCLCWFLCLTSSNYQEGESWTPVTSISGQPLCKYVIKSKISTISTLSTSDKYCCSIFLCYLDGGLVENQGPVLVACHCANMWSLQNKYNFNTEHQWQVLLYNISLLSGWWISWTPGPSINGLPLSKYVINPQISKISISQILPPADEGRWPTLTGTTIRVSNFWTILSWTTITIQIRIQIQKVTRAKYVLQRIRMPCEWCWPSIWESKTTHRKTNQVNKYKIHKEYFQLILITNAAPMVLVLDLGIKGNRLRKTAHMLVFGTQYIHITVNRPK